MLEIEYKELKRIIRLLSKIYPKEIILIAINVTEEEYDEMIEGDEDDEEN